jgi:hypothetical protein
LDTKKGEVEKNLSKMQVLMSAKLCFAAKEIEFPWASKIIDFDRFEGPKRFAFEGTI